MKSSLCEKHHPFSLLELFLSIHYYWSSKPRRHTRHITWFDASEWSIFLVWSTPSLLWSSRRLFSSLSPPGMDPEIIAVVAPILQQIRVVIFNACTFSNSYLLGDTYFWEGILIMYSGSTYRDGVWQAVVTRERVHLLIRVCIVCSNSSDSQYDVDRTRFSFLKIPYLICRYYPMVTVSAVLIGMHWSCSGGDSGI